MANTKQCNDCCKTLPITQFSKRKASKDGLQPKCRGCNSKDNKKFRREINPQHHAEWQRNNRKRPTELVSKYRRASKIGGFVYYIHSLIDDKWYVGFSQTPYSVRMSEHRIKYKRFKSGKSKLKHPLLFNSLDKHGWEGHRIGFILKDQTATRKELKKWEKECILFFKSIGKSLNDKL